MSHCVLAREGLYWTAAGAPSYQITPRESPRVASAVSSSRGRVEGYHILTSTMVLSCSRRTDCRSQRTGESFHFVFVGFNSNWCPHDMTCPPRRHLTEMAIIESPMRGAEDMFIGDNRYLDPDQKALGYYERKPDGGVLRTRDPNHHPTEIPLPQTFRTCRARNHPVAYTCVHNAFYPTTQT